MNGPVARHVALHDPASVLADVAAKREILSAHDRVSGYRTDAACLSCGVNDEYPAAWPCDTVKILASAYRDRPGYREEWAPEA
jgi:hypothetical protein